jgi:hypothetical protein
MALRTSVCAKSSPLNNSDSPSVMAHAWANERLPVYPDECVEP